MIIPRLERKKKSRIRAARNMTESSPSVNFRDTQKHLASALSRIQSVQQQDSHSEERAMKFSFTLTPLNNSNARQKAILLQRRPRIVEHFPQVSQLVMFIACRQL